MNFSLHCFFEVEEAKIIDAHTEIINVKTATIQRRRMRRVSEESLSS